MSCAKRNEKFFTDGVSGKETLREITAPCCARSFNSSERNRFISKPCNEPRFRSATYRTVILA
jgi:hypothetical protein